MVLCLNRSLKVSKSSLQSTSLQVIPGNIVQLHLSLTLKQVSTLLEVKGFSSDICNQAIIHDIKSHEATYLTKGKRKH